MLPINDTIPTGSLPAQNKASKQKPQNIPVKVPLKALGLITY